jgi:hypothetical protein
MNELVKLVSEKAGLSEEMAEMAVELVINYLKEKLPEPIAGQIDTVLGGAEAASGGGVLSKGLGSLFGKK